MPKELHLKCNIHLKKIILCCLFLFMIMCLERQRKGKVLPPSQAQF
jgi:hypothetical protein